jgi:alpha-glucosidase
MSGPSVIEAATIADDGLRLALDVGYVDVAWSAAGVLRLRMVLPDGPAGAGHQPELDPTFLPMDRTALPAWRTAVDTDADPLELPLGQAHRLRIERPLQFTLLRGDTVLWQSLAGRTLRVDALGRRWHYHARDDAHRLYGLGEKTGPLVRNHRSFGMRNVDAAEYDPATGDPLYKHIPFYLIHQPQHRTTIGVFLNNAWPTRFDFGAERSGYWPPYASICADGGDLDLFLFTGPQPADVLLQYHRLTGFPALPTKASLGYLGSTMTYTELDSGSDEAVLGFADRCAQEGIPLSGFHLSSGYTRDADGLRNTLTWDRRTFPDPAGFVEAFQRDGLVLSPNVKPAMLTTHPLYPQFDGAGAFITAADGSSATAQFWGGQASFVDFSNPVAVRMWREHLGEALLDLGVTSIWNDNNEFESDDDTALCNNDGHPVVAHSMRPVLSNLMARLAYEAVCDAGDARPFILSRAGFAGLQRYAQTWSGDNTSDWADFHYNVATMLGLSLSGMPFNGMDIGGFTGPAPGPELFARWVQNGAFHPRFSIHSVNSDGTVTEPWLYPELTPVIREAIRTRYALLPTIYSAAAQAHREGLPVVRPLVFEFPGFAPGRDRHTEFLLGPALLVVAVTEPGMEEVTVCFPPGEWTCIFTGDRVQGGHMARVPAPAERSTAYARTGHGYFLDGDFADEPAALIARLAMRAQGSAWFYDDDGRTRANEQGSSLRARYTWQHSTLGIHLRYQADGPYLPQWGRLRLDLDIGPTRPRRVTWRGDGGEFRHLTLSLPAAAIVRGWQLDLDLRA